MTAPKKPVIAIPSAPPWTSRLTPLWRGFHARYRVVFVTRSQISSLVSTVEPTWRNNKCWLPSDVGVSAREAKLAGCVDAHEGHGMPSARGHVPGSGSPQSSFHHTDTCVPLSRL